MSAIKRTTPLAELGAIVCETLFNKGIDAFLSGGAVVSIYTSNKYESFDLDFVSLADRRKIKDVMETLGFSQDAGRMYAHPKSEFTVEFPGSSMNIGNSLVTKFNELKLKNGTLRLLTPTDCVKDCLAAFYHWNDRQGLDQAVWVAQAQSVNLENVKHWSKLERKLDFFEEFIEALKKMK